MDPEHEVSAWVFGCTDTGLVRKNNEDAYVIADLTSESAIASSIPAIADAPFLDRTQRGEVAMLRKMTVGEHGLLLAVSDGMGGAEAGEFASYLVVESIREGLAGQRDSPTGSLVREAVERANNVVFETAGSHPRQTGMGATLTSVLVRDDRAYIACVGDSRCFIIRSGKVSLVTRDQSLVESLVELGHLTREQAESSPHRNVILQALGTQPEVAFALTRWKLYRGDMVLLCSDGLSGKVTSDELLELALAGPTIEIAGRRMVALANERGGEDNITLILTHFGGPGLEVAPEGRGVTGTLEKIHGFNHAAGSGYEDNRDLSTKKLEPATPVTRKLDDDTVDGESS
ncbi:MAG: serine/threonine-protein phosphatase [Blastocatellia bacterium]|nr:serine/threonine-protein phosphatase [Blastocatellia bacterium]